MKRKLEFDGGLMEEGASEHEQPRDMAIWGPPPVHRLSYEPSLPIHQPHQPLKSAHHATLLARKSSESYFQLPPASGIRKQQSLHVQQQTPLLSIPAEVRNKIYQLSLVNEDVVLDVKILSTPTEPALLATCRQIRHEASSIFYGENTFHTDITVGTSLKMVDERAPCRWLASLGMARCGLLGDLRITTTFRTRGPSVYFDSTSQLDTVLIRRAMTMVPPSALKRYKNTKCSMDTIISTLCDLGVRVPVISLMDQQEVGLPGLPAGVLLKQLAGPRIECSRTFFKSAGDGILAERSERSTSVKKPAKVVENYPVEVLGYRVTGRHDSLAKQRQIIQRYIDNDYYIDERV